MKHNKKNRRGNQPRQNRQPQQHAHADLMKRMTLLGADIKITESQEVTLPREEYDKLQYCANLVDILRRVYKSSGKYAMSDLLENIFKEADKAIDEKEDK